MLSILKSPTTCIILILMLGCAHRPSVDSLDMTPQAESPAQSKIDIVADAPPPQIDGQALPYFPLPVDDDDQPIDTDGVTPAIPQEETAAHDAPALEPISPEIEIQQQLDEALVFCETAQEFWQKGELESALEALDKAYALILTVSASDPDKMVQQKEDLRFLISKRILEIYASRNIVVNGNHNAIPRELNRNIQKEIDLFTKGGERRFFIESYKRSGKYRPMILEKLKAAGIPAELSWLPLIESGFKVKALSHARALGLWQFIPSTGYKFGLSRNQYIDERMDFEKASDAAIAYLKELHRIFGDWSTVLAAYNCGEGRVLHVIRTQNIKYLDDFWDLFGRLPYETARYVPRFLACLHVIENLEKYGLSEIEVYPALQFETADINRQVNLKDLAAPLGIGTETLKELNPELRFGVVPPSSYPLRVPVGKKERLWASIDRIPVSSPPRSAFVYHRVRQGETLSTIARRYRTSVKKIMWANNLKRSSYIVAGKKLKIPQRGMVIAQTPVVVQPDRSWNRKHVVKSGDSLWIIAKQYGTTTQKIQQMNGLSSTGLTIKQVLKVPSPRPQSPADTAGSGSNYHVQRGESPYIIARKHDMSLNRFLKINDLTPRSTIYPGQAVKIE